MDPSFFGLDGQPFGVSAGSEEPFLSDAHAALTTEFNAGLKAPHGITLLIGEEGAGKTTFVRNFAARLSDSAEVAFLPSTGPGLRHLLTEVIEQLGGTSTPSGDEQALLDKLVALARARAEHERTTLVVLDEAHELPAKTIERLGRLFGDDPAEPSMLHVVLVGRPELLDRMNAANDRSILKHLIQVCRMDPIGPEESFQYIAHRIQKVGGVVDRIFSEDALRLIVKRAEGLPAKIDKICEAALEHAEERGENSVGAEAVDLACMGVEGFVVEESSVRNQEVESSNYVFSDDQFEQDEMLGVGNGPAAAGSASAGFGGHAAAGASPQPNRRRLLLWAVGAIAVAGGFAATMTGTGDEVAVSEPVKVAAVERDAVAAVAARPASKQPAGALVAAKAAMPTDPVAVPKLVVKRGAGAKRKVEAKGHDRKNTGGAGHSAPLVHAAPRPSATGRAPLAPVRPPTAGNRRPAAPASANTPIRRPAEVRPATAAGAAAKPERGAATRAAANARPVAAPSARVAAAPAAAAVAARPARQATPVREPESVPAARAKPVVAPPIRTPPKPPVAARQAPATVASAKAAPTVAPRTAPARVAAVKPVAPVAIRYTVQVGAFSVRGNAEALLAKVRGSYPDGRIVVASSGGKQVFRVVSGAFASKSSADLRARALKNGGYNTYVRQLAQ